MRVSVVQGSEIAETLCVGRQVVYNALWTACHKAGMRKNPATLTHWAVKRGDQSLGEETSETRPYPGKPAKPGQIGVDGVIPPRTFSGCRTISPVMRSFLRLLRRLSERTNLPSEDGHDRAARRGARLVSVITVL